jgi:hypothetical protein
MCNKVARNTVVMLERLGKVCGWAGTGLAVLIVVWGFLTWHPGSGGPLYFGVLAAVVVFSSGRRFATSLLASHLTNNFRHPVGFVPGAKIIGPETGHHRPAGSALKDQDKNIWQYRSTE